ncbi:transposable element Tcb1 transposase [Trichonephila clavipes]|nr:transposable element Tcb1 transposase [Trichonephila clavipes]
MTVKPAVDDMVLDVHTLSRTKVIRMSCMVKQNQSQTVAQLTTQYNSGPSRIVSEHTVQWTLLDMKLCSKRPTCVPLLTKCHRQLRLRWAQEHHNWSMDQFAIQSPSPDKRGVKAMVTVVAWSDESQFVIHHADGRVRIRRLPGEQLLPQCTVGHTQAGGGGILLWGTFSWASLGPVVVVEQTMNTTGYLNIIADQLHPYMVSVFPAGNGMFQQDNASCHKAKIVLELFQEHDAEFQLMSWPPNSPDLNPIEHIWDVMGGQLRVQRPSIRNISDLRDRCLNIWYNLSPAIYQGLVASMPRRVEAVLHAKDLQDPSGSDLKPQNASKNSSVADEFDMFAQSRNTSFGSSKNRGSSYEDNTNLDQIEGGLASFTANKGKPMEGGDSRASDAKPNSGDRLANIPSVAGATAQSNAISNRRQMDKDDADSALFAL